VFMATVLFSVNATIPGQREAAFNRWYNYKHCPQFLRYPGAVSARRYKAILGEDTYRYMAVYEVQDEKTFRALMKSGHMKALRRDYDRWFGKVSERARFAYTQVWSWPPYGGGAASGRGDGPGPASRNGPRARPGRPTRSI